MTMNIPVSDEMTQDLQPRRLREAFEAARPALEALDGKPLETVNLEIPAAVITVRGCLPELRALLPRVLAELPAVDPEIFDKCERYTHALAHTHRQLIAASQPAVSIGALTDTLKDIHDVLYTDVTALAKRGLLDGERLKMLSGTNGSKNTAWDVLALVAMLRDNWTKIAGRTGVTLAELEQAEGLADQLSDALGAKEQGPSTAPEASIMRTRAFTLFSKTYDEVRRIVTFLRWHEGDADEIAPTLYNGRGSPRRKEEPVAVAPPVAPPAPNGNGAAPAPAVSSGMPGESPLIGR